MQSGTVIFCSRLAFWMWLSPIWSWHLALWYVWLSFHLKMTSCTIGDICDFPLSDNGILHYGACDGSSFWKWHYALWTWMEGIPQGPIQHSSFQNVASVCRMHQSHEIWIRHQNSTPECGIHLQVEESSTSHIHSVSEMCSPAWHCLYDTKR